MGSMHRCMKVCLRKWGSHNGYSHMGEREGVLEQVGLAKIGSSHMGESKLGAVEKTGSPRVE